MKKITSVVIHQNPFKMSHRAHKKLDYMIEARFEDLSIERKFFTKKTEAKIWLGRQYFLGRFILKKDENNPLH